MTPGPGIEPGTHWWKASALTTTPTLLPPNPAPPNAIISARLLSLALMRSPGFEFLRKYSGFLRERVICRRMVTLSIKR